MLRFKHLLGTLCLVPALAAHAAGADGYPSKPVKIVIGSTAGGPTDTVARVVADHLARRLGQPFVVEIRSGAGGTIGGAYVAKAAPDGYTLGVAVQGTHAVAPYLYPNVGYDPVNDFVDIIRLVDTPLLMTVNPSSPFKTVADVVDYARANPGRLNFATGGVGSSPHMSMELLKKAAKIDMTPIHYKGDSAALVDVLSGQVGVMTSNIVGPLSYVQNGKLRPVAVTSLKRSPLLPDVPTIAESGYPGFEVITWFGLVGPAKTPKAIVDRLNQETRIVLGDPAVQAQFAKLGFEVVPDTPEQFAQFMRDENVKYGGLIKELGLKLE
ncbi:tripartite tricarboxylate transporter substrate binding protein [Pigmentiphaga soli]|uniref:Tripartite tricarboxylate transporter substrate binding protein n=1 Tax=Pigmentiphaga soli TaxID=1007095 RepID=A0ABP8GG21_9BURK